MLAGSCGTEDLVAEIDDVDLISYPGTRSRSGSACRRSGEVSLKCGEGGLVVVASAESDVSLELLT